MSQSDAPCSHEGACVGLLDSSRKALEEFFSFTMSPAGKASMRTNQFLVNTIQYFHDLDAFAHYGDPKNFICRFQRNCSKCGGKKT